MGKGKYKKRNINCIDCDNYSMLLALLLIICIFCNKDSFDNKALDKIPNSYKDDNSPTKDDELDTPTYYDNSSEDNNPSENNTDTYKHQIDDIISSENPIEDKKDDNFIGENENECDDDFISESQNECHNDSINKSQNECPNNLISKSQNESHDDFISEGQNECDAKLISSKTLTECHNEYIKPCGKNGFFVAKIPVIISELKVEINCSSAIKFNEEALKIKKITQDVCLTQCKLIAKANKLFIKGHVKRNIEYVPTKCYKHEKYSRKVKQLSINIPFECVTNVNYFTPPEINDNENIQELNIYNSDILDRNIIEHYFIDKKYLNEKVYCELIKAKILGAYSEEENGNNLINRPTSKCLDEQMVLYLTLRLLQNQQLNISSSTLALV